MAAPEKYKASVNAKVILLLQAGTIKRFVDIAYELGVDKVTLYNWADNYPDFRKTLNVCNIAFERRIHEMMDSGAISPVVGVFQLKCNYKAIEHSVDRDLTRKDRELDARIKGEIKDGASAELTVVFKDAEEA